MRIPLEQMSLTELEQHHAVFSQVNHLTGKIQNPDLAEQAQNLINQKKEQENALLH